MSCLRQKFYFLYHPHRAVYWVFLLGVFIGCFGCASRPVAPLSVLGVWHTVDKQDTVASVAKQYGANPNQIAEINDIPLEGEIENRAEIFVLKNGGEPPGTGAPPPKPVNKIVTPQIAKSKKNLGSCQKGGAKKCYQWPAAGKIGAKFGPLGGKHHDGLDIVGPVGTPIYAAAEGRVIYSGDEIKGYGNLILLAHKDGTITVYAHNQKNGVQNGDTVQAGDEIAKMGKSGSATGPHLHFEVRVKERPRNPLLYLPAKQPK